MGVQPPVVVGQHARAPTGRSASRPGSPGETGPCLIVDGMALFGRKRHPSDPPQEATVPEEALPLRSPDDHGRAALENVEPLTPVGVRLDDAFGLTLCEDIDSDLDIPMVTTSRIEGYGIRAANIVGASPSHPIELRVVGVVERTDTLPSQAVAPGACVLLGEGAPVPKGVDAVVPLADAPLTGRDVSFTFEAKLHQNMTLRGSELADGTRLLDSGSVLDSRAVGLLAEAGLDQVLARPKARVAVVATGPGLVAPGEPLTAIDKQYAAAPALLAAEAQADGASVERLGVLGRDTAALRACLTESASKADVLLVLAESDADALLVSDLLGAIGSVDRAHVALGDGAVQAIGRPTSGPLVLVLPAAPVEAMASYRTIVAPVLDRLAGRARASEKTTSLDVPTGVRRADGVRNLPAAWSGDALRPVGTRGRLAFDLHRADGLLVVPATGAQAQFVPFGRDAAGE